MIMRKPTCVTRHELDDALNDTNNVYYLCMTRHLIRARLFYVFSLYGLPFSLFRLPTRDTCHMVLQISRMYTEVMCLENHSMIN